MKCYIPNENELKRIKQMASEGQTLSAIAIMINHDRSTVKRLLKLHNIELKPTPKNRQGKTFIWNAYKMRHLKELYSSDQVSINDVAQEFQTSAHTILMKAKELNLHKVPVAYIKKADKEYLRNNAGKKTLSEMGKELNMNPWTLGKQLTKMGISVRCSKRLLPPETKEFNQDLINPSLSNAFLARKYKVHGSTIKKWRIEKFGSFKNMVDTYLCKSTAEMDFENILQELNLAFIYEYKFKQWKIDYNLGFNFLVEIYGSHWHDEIQKTIERDQRKNKDLTDNGFTVIVIWDYELQNKDNVKNKVLKTLKKCIDIYYKNMGFLTL